MAGTAVCGDPLAEFWQENGGKTVRRLPVSVVPENVFWSFGDRDFSDGFKAFDRLMEEGLAKSTYNCITLTLRCNTELGDAETLSAARRCIEKAHREGVKVYIDTDPRIARREFFAKWPSECQSLAHVIVSVPMNGVATFRHEFKSVQDHMSWGSKSSYRPLKARVASSVAVKRSPAGCLDFATARPVAVDSSLRERSWNESATQFSEIVLEGTLGALAADETLLVTALADYYSIDVFSPHLIPFCREQMKRYRDLGADGGMRDEWGFLPMGEPDCQTFFWSPNFEDDYRRETGRSLLGDFPRMGAGAVGDAKRSAAICAYMKLTLARQAEIERDFYECDKRLFGPETYVVKHPTWYASVCPAEYFHNGLDWWQARRDWAQGDEETPIYALWGMAKKFGGPVWLNEGYTATPERNAFRVWTYSLCGGRQVYHGLSGGDAKTREKYQAMPWSERRVRKSTDLLAPANVTAQSRVRLVNLITRSQVNSPVAYVFGHENLVDWSGAGWNDHGRNLIMRILSQGWWCDAYPASEFALGTFKVDEEGYLRVGQQRYVVLALYHLSAAERMALNQVIAGRVLKTEIFAAENAQTVVSVLEKSGVPRQPCVKASTAAGSCYPEPDGTLHLIDGTAVRIAADMEHLSGRPLNGKLVVDGLEVEFAAEGLFAARAEQGRLAAIAAGGLTRVKGTGISLELEAPADVALIRRDGEWRGVWQTSDAVSPIPSSLAALTTHWIRLLIPGFQTCVLKP